jgi:hypothetical protein
MEDMAICGEEINNYYLLSNELPKSKIDYKLKLNETILQRKAEQSKWSWLNPDKLDLVTLSTLFGCHSNDELIKYIKSINSTTVNNNQLINFITNMFFSDKDYNYVFIQIRKVEDDWRKLNNIQTNAQILWITTYYKNRDIIGSQEFWIDVNKKQYQYLSDYWNAKWEGRTTPGFKKWIVISDKKTKFNKLVSDIIDLLSK